jgi:hypothetical protein
MRKALVAFAILAITVSTESLDAAEKRTQDEAQYTSAQIKRMVHDAHTVEQYTALTDYYATQQRMYKRKAAEEMHLWALRAEVITPLSEKWPRPVDSSRNRYEYYEYRVAQAGLLCAKYTKLADEAAARQAEHVH